jgi:long-chain acyl-CoA synthetase
MNQRVVDYISPELVYTLDGLFHERVRRSPQDVAYRYFDEAAVDWREITWQSAMQQAVSWQQALLGEHLAVGDRVAIMLKNCPSWVMFDQAALGLGLVTVPLYVSDRAENVAHVLQDSGAKLLLVNSISDWQAVHALGVDFKNLQRVIVCKPVPAGGDDQCIRSLDTWLPVSSMQSEFQHRVSDANALATIIYTSGTTGKPKGVMLTHCNLMYNARDALVYFAVYPHDVFLSFLPLSHALERMAGYCLPMMSGASVAFARSVQQLQDDLLKVRPTIIVTVPRIFERIQLALRSKLESGPTYAMRLFALAVEVGYSRFEYEQGRAQWQWRHLLWPILKRLVASKLQARLGGRLRLAVAGGAALPAGSARTFIGLGVPIVQGYGLTETSPVISVNKAESNLPSSVGHALPSVQVRLDASGGLEVRGPNVMQGYWNNVDANKAIFTADGWLKTGDVANIDQSGHITITGRIKEIIVLSNGEKVPPNDIEAAIMTDPLFEQVMLIGEGKPYLGLLAVVNQDQWLALAQKHDLPSAWPDALDQREVCIFALARVAAQMKSFPGYAKVRKIALLPTPWTIENGLLTPTLKIKRHLILQQYATQCEKLYEGFKF